MYPDADSSDKSTNCPIFASFDDIRPKDKNDIFVYEAKAGARKELPEHQAP